MILVTGATGTTGAAVVQELMRREVPFRAMARNEDKARGMFGNGVDFVYGDMTDEASLRAAMAGVNTLFLLTPPDEQMATLNHQAVVAAEATGVSHVVKLSAIGASVESPLQLGRWHGSMEEELAESGLGFTILRAASFMQNFFNHVPTILDQGQVYSGNGDGEIAMIDVRDIGDAAARILIDPTTHHGRSYELTGGKALSDREATARLAKALERDLSFMEISGEAAAAAMKEAGLPAWLIGDLVKLGDMAKAGYMANVSPDAAELLGREPRTFSDFAVDHRADFS